MMVKHTVERLSMRIANRISKQSWVRRGGFSNPRLARVTRNGRWAYYWLH